MRTPRKFTGLSVLLFGALSLFIKLSNPRVQALFPSDVIALVAAGLCLGVGITVMINKRMARAK
jgi:hypothetical protein